MTIACYLEPAKPKAHFWMRSFAQGCRGRIVKNGQRYPLANDHVIMGNWPVAGRLIPEVTPNFWYLDSAYIQRKTGRPYLRVERGRFWPEFAAPQSMERAHAMGVRLHPWRYDGRHVLVCLHGPKFGRPWSIAIAEWHETIEARVRAVTDRPIVMRAKPYTPAAMRSTPLLQEQLADAWCMVTHSSTAAVTAAIMGVPVFCEPTCAAAAVGCTDLSQIESPRRPDREAWIAALVLAAMDRYRNGQRRGLGVS